MTEQNYADPGQSAPVSQIEVQVLQQQNSQLLERIAQLEALVSQLQQQQMHAEATDPA
jgi:cell division protein FtsB